MPSEHCIAKSICRTLDKILIQQEVPHSMHELTLTVDLNFCLWYLLCLFLILAAKVSAKLQ